MGPDALSLAAARSPGDCRPSVRRVARGAGRASQREGVQARGRKNLFGRLDRGVRSKTRRGYGHGSPGGAGAAGVVAGWDQTRISALLHSLLSDREGSIDRELETVCLIDLRAAS